MLLTSYINMALLQLMNNHNYSVLQFAHHVSSFIIRNLSGILVTFSHPVSLRLLWVKRDFSQTFPYLVDFGSMS